MKKLILALLIALGATNVSAEIVTPVVSTPETAKTIEAKTLKAEVVAWVKAHPKKAAAILIASIASGIIATDLIRVARGNNSFIKAGYNGICAHCKNPFHKQPAVTESKVTEPIVTQTTKTVLPTTAK